MIEIGDSKGELPSNNKSERESSEETISYAVRMLKTYFESMSEQEYESISFISKNMNL
jgi:hypothetical protein